jgi:hypothetical protein
MKNHNNIYNILGKLSALEPKAAPAKNILNELSEPAPMKDLASRLNERYLAEKDMGKHNNATTGFKALAKKAGGGEKGDKIAGAQFQKMKKAGQLEEEGMSRAAKGYEKYGQEGMEALAKAGKAGKDLDPIRKKYDKYDNEQVDEAEVDEDMLSPKQKKIAGLRPPPGKIDANDLAALRAGKSKEKEGNEFSGELAKAKAQHRDSFSVDGKEYPVKEDDFDSHDSGEYDREGEMADQDLETAEDAAEELRSILSADENLPEWVQAKITKAVDYLDTARDYMQSKDQEPDLQEGWDEMTKAVKDRAEAEKKDQGTGRYDKKTNRDTGGTIYTRKSDTFADAGDDSENKASDGPKKKGRPKKNTGPERVTAKAYKHKGGRVSESVKLDTFVEDTLSEMDSILYTKTPVAQQQKFMGMVRSQKVTEGVLLENTLQAIEHRYGKEVREFMETGELDEDLYHALYDYYFDDMPYGVKKARDGDPYEWVSDHFFDDMGGAGYLNRKDKADGVEESGALHPGMVVYYRGKPGKIDRIEGNKCFVHVGGGDMDVWPTNSCSTEKQSFMSTMKNDIKDIGHGMKGFLTGGPETRELDELAKLAGLGQHKLGEAACNMTAEGTMCAKHGMAECWSSGGGMMEAKGSKPDFLDMDKDGDKEEPMKKAVDDKKKNPFGNKKEELDECDMPGPMSPMGGPETESGMNISGSMDTKTGRKTLTVTADGEAAEELAQMLKMAGMAGMGGHEGMHSSMEEPEAHAAGKIVLINPHADMMGEAYANNPDEKYFDTDVITDQGADLNRKKKQFKHSYRQGDNPEAIKLESRLQSLYDSLKVKK